MRASEEGVSEVVEAFQAAGLGAGSWTAALARLASATGSRSAQLIGVGSDAVVSFNWATNLPTEGLEEFLAINGGDPRINPRVRAGLASSELEIMTEAEFASEAELRSPIYADFYNRYDVPHTCQTTVLRGAELAVGLSVLRSRKEGQVSPEQRDLFARVAPHVRAAIRTQMALQAQGAALVAGAMESLSIAAFVCDGRGRVRAMSPQAEALARAGAHLRVRNGQLSAWSEPDTRALSSALNAAAFSPASKAPLTTLVVRDQEGVDPVLVEVSAVPGERHNFGFGVAALVVVRTPRPADGRAAMLARAMFGLTQAEAAVAGDLAAGLSAQTISERSGTSVNTVRTHIKRAFEKAGVSSQLELVSLITARL